MKKRLIINADDFGFSESVNQGIITAHVRGVVSSTSLMVNMPYCEQAVQLARVNPKLGVGLHINLTCGQPLSPAKSVSSLVDEVGEFHPISTLLIKLQLGTINPEHLKTEINAQFAKYMSLQIPCTHFDGHRHISCVPKVFAVIAPIAKSYGINKCRISLESPSSISQFDWRKISASYLSQYSKFILLKHWAKQCQKIAYQHNINFPTGFYGIVAMSESRPTNYLIEFFSVADQACSEIMCHPATSDDKVEFLEGYDSRKRQRELDLLTDASTQEAMQKHGLELISYQDL